MAKSNYYGLILAGGRGTRFWPRSRKRHAKQVLNVAGERTLIQDTVERLNPVIPPERLWILTNGFVRDEIVKQLPEVPQEQILAEPSQRNTAPAIGLAAHILRSIDPKAVFGVFPSDHIIGQPKKYLKLLKPAFRAAEKGHIAVLGIAPRWPETGYGYIEFPKGATAGASDVVKIRRFREKPELPQARKFLKAVSASIDCCGLAYSIITSRPAGYCAVTASVPAVKSIRSSTGLCPRPAFSFERLVANVA